MSEFSLTEQLMMTKDLSDQQKMLFESQFNSAKRANLIPLKRIEA